MNVGRGRRSAGLARVYRVSDRLMFERNRDLAQRRASGWPSQAIMQSGTCLAKREWQKIALFYAVARLAKLRQDRLITPDLAMRARGQLELRSDDQQ